jgi:hypothetical protein
MNGKTSNGNGNEATYFMSGAMFNALAFPSARTVSDTVLLRDYKTHEATVREAIQPGKILIGKVVANLRKSV